MLGSKNCFIFCLVIFAHYWIFILVILPIQTTTSINKISLNPKLPHLWYIAVCPSQSELCHILPAFEKSVVVWNAVISPPTSSYYVGFSILFRLVRISPLAYLLNLGHNIFFLYSATSACNFSSFRLLPRDLLSSSTLLSRYCFRRDLEWWDCLWLASMFNLNHASLSLLHVSVILSGSEVVRPYCCLCLVCLLWNSYV